jgi:hypothetical protein
MRGIAAWTVLVVALATTVSMAQSSAGTRGVVLDLSLPNGATPQLKIAEGGLGSVEVREFGKFGFVPTFREGDDKVVIELFDLSKMPHERIDRMEMIAGAEMQFATKQPIGVRVAKIITK